MKKRIRASDLAEVATCERRVYLRNRLGERETREQRAAKARGTALHEMAYRQRSADQKTADKRCFIATAVYGGEAWETQVLRRFRDERLRTSWAGRAAISVYYACSPAVARLMENRPGVKRAGRWVLDRVVRAVSVRRRP